MQTGNAGRVGVLQLSDLNTTAKDIFSPGKRKGTSFSRVIMNVKRGGGEGAGVGGVLDCQKV